MKSVAVIAGSRLGTLLRGAITILATPESEHAFRQRPTSEAVRYPVSISANCGPESDSLARMDRSSSETSRTDKIPCRRRSATRSCSSATFDMAARLTVMKTILGPTTEANGSLGCCAWARCQALSTADVSGCYLAHKYNRVHLRIPAWLSPSLASLPLTGNAAPR